MSGKSPQIMSSKSVVVVVVVMVVVSVVVFFLPVFPGAWCVP